MVEALYCVAFEHEHDSLHSYGDGFHFLHNSLVDGIIYLQIKKTGINFRGMLENVHRIMFQYCTA